MSKLFFLGAGNMATAIAAGLVKSGALAAADMAAYDVNQSAVDAFSERSGVAARTAGCRELIATAECVLLAVKPQTLPAALDGLQDTLRDKAVISIVAGVPLTRLEALTGSSRIVRVMPNTPALVGCGAAAYATSGGAKPEDIALTETIFNAVGLCVRVEEKQLDAVTALSGSGPAYVFAFLQALADGGVACGLPREQALRLAIQTVKGAALMAQETGRHPVVLKDEVASPGGTTIRALEILEENAFSGSVMQAIRGAFERSRELGG